MAKRTQKASRQSSGRVIIVGAGLAGLASATKLAKAGVEVQLYEAAPHAGGRCRSYADSQLGQTIDNGNHLLLRANKQALAYIRRIGATGAFHPFRKCYHFMDTQNGARWTYAPSRWPRGVRITDIWRLIRLLFLAGKRRTVSEIIPPDSPFSRYFIEPLCTAMLNTHPSHASAQMFGRCLRTLCWPKQAHYLQARTPLSEALITPAIRLIEKHGGTLHFNQRLTGGEADGNRLTKLIFSRINVTLEPHDIVIFALPAEAVSQLLPVSAPQAYNQILNIHFAYDTAQLPPHIIGITNSPAQWVFVKEGIIATTTSDFEHSELYKKTPQRKAEIVWHDVARALELPASPVPAHRIVTEKRATYAATPEELVRRPAMSTAYRNLLLAGDWIDSPLPATIEAAIASGHNAADWHLQRKRVLQKGAVSSS